MGGALGSTGGDKVNMFTSGRAFWFLGSFFVGLVGTLVTIREFSPGSSENGEECVVRLERGAVNRGIESDSPTGEYKATVTDVGSRSVSSSLAIQPLDIFEIVTNGKAVVQLYQYGDLDTIWSEFGQIEWTAASRVKFVHNNDVDPVGSYQVEFVLHEK